MKLYIVYMHYNNPPMIMFGETRAKVGRIVKSMLGPDMVNEVVPISNQDAEAQFGDQYKRLAQMNMLRSETVSILTGDNPFLREKMDIKKADMGDVVDDFKKSDAPQFQGKSMAKRRQMAIAAKLNTEGAMKRMATQDAEKERLGDRKVKGDGMDTFKKKYPDHLSVKKAKAAFAPTKGGADVKKEDVKLSEAMVDQKLIKTLKAMMKDGDADSVRLLVQGLPKNMKKDVMKKIGMKEQVDGRTKAFKETIERLNLAKVKTVEEEDEVTVEEDQVNEKTAAEQEAEGGGHIVMQLRKSVSMRGQKDVKFNDGSTHKVSAAHADKFLSKHASLKSSHEKRALQSKAAKSHDHLQKSIREEDLEERTPIKATIQDKKQKNLRVPNPRYKKMQDTRPERKKKMADAFEGKDEVGIDKPEEATNYTSMDFFSDYIKTTNKK